MANTILAPLTYVDQTADVMRPYFGGSISSTTQYNAATNTMDNSMGNTSPNWYVEELDESLSGEAATCKIIIEAGADSTDEPALSTEFNPDGPVADILHGTAVCVRKGYTDSTGTYQEQLMFIGQVLKVRHRVKGGLEVTAKDVRHLLKDIRVVGRWIVTPSMITFQYQHGWPSHFNPGGRPNCIFRAGMPCFAPWPDYGIPKDQGPPDPSQQSETQACYWTFQNMIAYILGFWGPSLPDQTITVVQAAKALWPELQTIPGWVTIPESIGSGLDEYYLNNFNQGVGQNNSGIGGARKGPDVNISYVSLIGIGGEKGVFDRLLSKAGGWAIKLTYSESLGASTTLNFVRNRWEDTNDGVDIPFCIGPASSAPYATVTGGSYEESSEFTVTRAVGHGSLPKIETRVDTTGVNWSSTGATYAYSGNPALLPAWSPNDFNAWSTLAVQGGVANAQTFAEANAQYPWVLTAYILNPTYNFQTGTRYSANPLAPITRPVWPTLLTFQGSATAAGDIFPYPIRSECNQGSWTLGPEFDGLEVFDDGIIYLPKLRDIKADSDGTSAGSFKWNSAQFGVSGGNKLDITPNDIRMSIAIPVDHRLSMACGMASDIFNNSSAIGQWSILEDSPDADKLAPNFSRQIIVDLNGMYDMWLRITSWPVPASVPGQTAAADLPGGFQGPALRDDSTLLQGHVFRTLDDQYRLARDGPLEFDGIITTYGLGQLLNNAIPVGSGASSQKPFPLRAVTARRRFSCIKSADEFGSTIYKTKSQIFPG
jgi:hypothetical protein